MPRCYMVRKGLRSTGSSPCPSEEWDSPPIRPFNPDEDPPTPETPMLTIDCDEIEEIGSIPITERTAEETEAAHELLSLAQSLPPLPPVQPLQPEPQLPAITPISPFQSLQQLPVLPPSIAPLPSLSSLPSLPSLVSVLPNEPVVPIYTYTVHPTNIYIIADERRDHTYSMPTITPIPCGIEYTIEPQLNYLAYQTIPEPVMPVGHILIPAADIIPVNNGAEPSRVTEITEPPSRLPCLINNPPPKIKPIPATRSKNGKYDCQECGKSYATSSNLSRHKQTHRSLDSVAAKRCEDCGKVYVSMPALAMHVLTHQMGHVCGICGKLFSRPWLLRGHLRSHTGEKPYTCPVEGCPRAFADRSNLRAHLQTHTGDKKFECTKCHKSFALKSYLAKHEETVCYKDEIALDPEFIRTVVPETSGMQSAISTSQSNMTSGQSGIPTQQNTPYLQSNLDNPRPEVGCVQPEPAIIQYDSATKEANSQAVTADAQTNTDILTVGQYERNSQQPTGLQAEMEDMLPDPDDPPQPAVIRFDPSCVMPVPHIIRYDTMSFEPVFAE